MFGRWDAEAFLDEMDADQFDRWRVYANVEPFGPMAEDRRNGMLLAMYANTKRDTSKRKEPFTSDDFMTCRTDPKSKRKLPAKILKEMMTAAIGKPDG